MLPVINKIYQVINKMLCTPNRTTRLKEVAKCTIVFLLTPAYFWILLFIIRPHIREHYQWSQTKHLFHIFLVSYMFINVAGNLILCVLTDSRVKEYRGPGTFCEYCVQKQPAESWHCKTCDACIQRRDHHSTFLAHCIGRNNQRYFTAYFCHLAITVIYATYYNYLVLNSVFDLKSYVETVAKLFNIGNWSIRYTSWIFRKRMFVFFWFWNLILIPFAINLALFHLYKAFRGLTWYEYKKGKVPIRTQWKRNMAYVFGTRWYLAILCPCVHSPLPCKRVSNSNQSLHPEMKI